MSKRDDDILLEGIRKRLENYSEPLPEGSWALLEKELCPRKIPFYRSWRSWSAAAVLLACIFSLGWWLSGAFTEKGGALPVADAGSFRQQNQPLPEGFPAVAAAQGTAKVEMPLGKVARPSRSGQLLASASVAADEDAAIGDTACAEEAVAGKEEAEETFRESGKDSLAGASVVQKRNQPSGRRAWMASNTAPKRQRKRQKWSMGVSYLNMGAVKNEGLSGFHSLKEGQGGISIGQLPSHSFSTALPAEDKLMQDALLNNVGHEPPRTCYEHKMPVSTGFSFRYAFTDRFAIETGLTYTMLSSELESNSSTGVYVEEYKLHYLGIPVKGNWIFLDTKFLTMYLSAGFALEKSVSGKYERVYLSGDGENAVWNETVKPMQWSLLGNVGVQFNATERFGIYVEPGVAHYFDDGSGVQTIRTEKPTNFNLQLGLRWTY